MCTNVAISLQIVCAFIVCAFYLAKEWENLLIFASCSLFVQIFTLRYCILILAEKKSNLIIPNQLITVDDKDPPGMSENIKRKLFD